MYRLLFIFYLLLVSSCGGKKESEPIGFNMDKTKEPLINVNKKIGKDEKRAIDAYVARRKWDMIETGTGVRYMIYEKGDGLMPKPDDLVMIDFEIQLLDGSVCYSSKETGSEQFMVEHDDVESGLHEAIQYLHEGDRAIIIIPSHRAFGLAGDNDKIPSFATLVYHIHLLKVIPKSKA